MNEVQPTILLLSPLEAQGPFHGTIVRPPYVDERTTLIRSEVQALRQVNAGSQG
ncbi:hypothetical protein CCACVL1_26524 [Corchorus capsularis]|uniref:Uncharacterized protein n=1 Tax=Corchorus capsularis TaxID=210143 RepID=A0A1R3GEC9_COCAP|nr:hypothetical protein CCACVL1_26524 [Corchorus capsularis]